MLNIRFSNYICYFMMFFAGAIQTVIGVMLSDLIREFGLTLSQSGLLYTAEFTGFFVLIFVTGILSDKIGKRVLFIAVIMALAVFLFIFSISHSFNLSLVIMFFAGGLCGSLQSLINSALIDLNPSAPDKHIIINGAFFGLGAMAGPVIAGFCLNHDISWRTVYMWLAVVGLLVLVPSFFMKIPKAKKAAKISLGAIKNIIKDWRFMLVCFSLFLYCGAEASAWGWMSEYMDVNLGFGVLKSAIAIGVFWLSITIGRLINLPVIKKIRARTVLGVLAAGSAVVTLAGAFVSSEIFAWIIVFLMGLFYSGQNPIMISQAGQRHAEHSGTSIALLVGSCGIGMSTIPALLGVMTDRFGVFVSQIIPAFFFVVILIVYCFIAKPESASSKE